MGRKEKEPQDQGSERHIGSYLRHARQEKSISLTHFAEQIGYTKSHISAVENGQSKPSFSLVQKYEDHLQLESGALSQHSLLPQYQTTYYSTVHEHGAPYSRAKVRQQLPSEHKSRVRQVSMTFPHSQEPHQPPPIKELFGRENESAKIKTWLLSGEDRLIVIYGLGGIGKTSLAASLFKDQHVQTHYKHLVWFSLLGAPTLEEVLTSYIRSRLGDEQISLPTDPASLAQTCLEYLKQENTLLVFDNFDSVLPENNVLDTKDQNQEYEHYRLFLHLVALSQHQSCLLLTSKKKPKECVTLEAKTSFAKSYALKGVSVSDIQAILQEKQLSGNQQEWRVLAQKYSGNPLALKLIAASIRELFDGDIGEFLRSGGSVSVFDDLYDLLAQQFQRLSERESDLMHALALAMEPLSLTALQGRLIHLSQREALEALNSLKRRSMVESAGPARFNILPVIREYIIDRFLHDCFHEIQSQQLSLLGKFPLYLVQTKDYLRQQQDNLVLFPLVQKVQSHYSSQEYSVIFSHILDLLRPENSKHHLFAASNVLKLLVALKEPLHNYDFTNLLISQADLQNAPLSHTKFADAQFEHCRFTETFGGVLSLAVDQQGQTIAAGTIHCDIQLWQISNNILRHTYQGHTDWVRTLAFSPITPHLLVSGSDDQTLRFWDTLTGESLQVLRHHQGRIYTIAFHPQGKWLASGSTDTLIYLCNLEGDDPPIPLKGHHKTVTSLVFTPDGKLLISASSDHTIKIWDWENQICLHTYNNGHSDSIRTLAVSPNNRLLASSGHDGLILLWNLQQRPFKQAPKLLGRHRGLVYALAFYENSEILASAGKDRTISIWDTTRDERIKVLSGHGDNIRSLAFIPKKNLLASGGEDHTIRYWEPQTGLATSILQGYSSWFHALSFHSDGKLLAGGGEDWKVRLYQVEDGLVTEKRMLTGHKGRIRALAFHPHMSYLASGSEDTKIKLWEVQSGQCYRTIDAHEGRVYSLSFHPEGWLLASCGDDQRVKLWDTRSGENVHQWEGEHHGRVRSVCFSPDGTLLASAGEDQIIRVWDVKARKLVQQFWQPSPTHQGEIWSLAFHPKGDILASAGDDRIIHLWSTRQGTHLADLTGHSGRIWSISFNTHGNFLASGSEDQSIGIWDLESKSLLISIQQAHLNRVRTVQFQPQQEGQEEILASGGHDGTMRLWFPPYQKQPPRELRIDRPYEWMDITGVQGLSEAQKALLRSLGAIETDRKGISY